MNPIDNLRIIASNAGAGNVTLSGKDLIDILNYISSQSGGGGGTQDLESVLTEGSDAGGLDIDNLDQLDVATITTTSTSLVAMAKMLRLKSYTSAEEALLVPANGALIYNDDLSVIRGYLDGTWTTIGGWGTTGTVATLTGDATLDTDGNDFTIDATGANVYIQGGALVVNSLIQTSTIASSGNDLTQTISIGDTGNTTSKITLNQATGETHIGDIDGQGNSTKIHIEDGASTILIQAALGVTVSNILTVLGGLYASASAAKTADYAVQATDFYIRGDGSSNTVAIDCTSMANGQICIIRASNIDFAVTVALSASTYTFATAGDCVVVYYDGSQANSFIAAEYKQ